jgi:ribulose-5-phosphate 4-epimerase/fuculose-1-phosphate aldolase
MLLPDAREAIVTTCQELSRAGLVVGTAGNVSVRDGDLAGNVVHALHDRTACLMGNHGAVAIGPDLLTAHDKSVYLEWLCDVYLRASSAGTPRLLSPEQIAAVTVKLEEYGQRPPGGAPGSARSQKNPRFGRSLVAASMISAAVVSVSAASAAFACSVG